MGRTSRKQAAFYDIPRRFPRVVISPLVTTATLPHTSHLGRSKLEGHACSSDSFTRTALRIERWRPFIYMLRGRGWRVMCSFRIRSSFRLRYSLVPVASFSFASELARSTPRADRSFPSRRNPGVEPANLPRKPPPLPTSTDQRPEEAPPPPSVTPLAGKRGGARWSCSSSEGFLILTSALMSCSRACMRARRLFTAL